MLTRRLGYEVTLRQPELAVEWNRTHIPHVVQFDGLNGRWVELYEAMRKDNPAALYVLFSASFDAHQEASRRGVKWFSKSRFS